MKIIAQSQPPTKVSYIHLAYLSAALSNDISKGELVPVQAVLSAALATALACAALGAKLAGAGKKVRGAMITAMFGSVGVLGAFWGIHTIWINTRSNEQVVKHVIQTHQWWALREPEIAAGVEAAALTNRDAVSMAAHYYHLKSSGGKEEHPEYTVKAYKYAEDAFAMGAQPGWINEGDVTNYYWELIPCFQAALKKDKLTPVEKAWARQKLIQMKEEENKERQAKPAK